MVGSMRTWWDWQTDRQTDGAGYIGPFPLRRGGSNKLQSMDSLWFSLFLSLCFRLGQILITYNHQLQNTSIHGSGLLCYRVYPGGSLSPSLPLTGNTWAGTQKLGDARKGWQLRNEERRDNTILLWLTSVSRFTITSDCELEWTFTAYQRSAIVPMISKYIVFLTL